MRVSSTFGRIVRAALAVYAAWLTFLFGGQERLIFPGAFRDDAIDTAAPLPARHEWVAHPDGVRTELFTTLEPNPGSKKPLLVYLHGNGRPIGELDAPLALADASGYALALPEYRGYGRSGGEPSQDAITSDLVRIVDRLRAHPSVDPDRIVYYGRSLGAGFATQLATRRPPAGLVLETPLARVDVQALGYLAPPFLVRHPFRSDEALAEVDAPTLVLRHDRDTTAPPEDATALARIARSGTLVAIDAGHNDAGSPAEAARERRAVVEFLARIAHR